MTKGNISFGLEKRMQSDERRVPEQLEPQGFLQGRRTSMQQQQQQEGMPVQQSNRKRMGNEFQLLNMISQASAARDSQ